MALSNNARVAVKKLIKELSERGSYNWTNLVGEIKDAKIFIGGDWEEVRLMAADTL